MFQRVMRRVPLFRPRSARGAADSHGHGHHGDHHSYEPSGYLFQRVPGEVRTREGWELPWFIGMYGTMILSGIALYFKPDTRARSWAEREAKLRLEAANAKY